MRTIGPDELEALGHALEPSPDLVERQVQAALHRPAPPPRSRTPLLLAALAATVLGGLGLAWRLTPGPPPQVRVAPTSAWSDLRPGLAVTGVGEGSLVSSRIVWEKGKLVVSLDPGKGPLEVVTDLARVEVTGTVFSVDRGPFGTLVEVSRGKVEVTCTSGRQSSVVAGGACACTADAASALALSSALDADGHPPETVLAALQAGLADPHRPAMVDQSLRALAVTTHLRSGALAEAALAAAELDPSLPVGRSALAAVAAASEDCALVRPALQVLARTDAAQAIRLARCTEDRAEAVQILLQVREVSSPEARAVLDGWLETLRE